MRLEPGGVFMLTTVKKETLKQPLPFEPPGICLRVIVDSFWLFFDSVPISAIGYETDVSNI